MPPNNSIALFTGTDDYMYTRTLARWLDLDYVSIKKLDYDSISKLSDRFDEPWDSRETVRKIKYIIVFIVERHRWTVFSSEHTD
jgi:hypothetical protein